MVTPWMPTSCAFLTVPLRLINCAADAPTTLRSAVLTNLGDLASAGDGRQCAFCPGFIADAKTTGLAAPRAPTPSSPLTSIAVSVFRLLNRRDSFGTMNDKGL